MPDELRLSVFHHATPKLDLMATYTRQDFSVTTLNFQRESNGRTLENIPQNFVAAESYRVGMNYKLYKRLTLRAGYNHTNNPVSGANVTFSVFGRNLLDNRGLSSTLPVAGLFTFAGVRPPRQLGAEVMLEF